MSYEYVEGIEGIVVEHKVLPTACVLTLSTPIGNVFLTMASKFSQFNSVVKKLDGLKGQRVKTMVSKTTGPWSRNKYFCDVKKVD